METVTLTIDGRQVTVEKGKTVLQAAIESGITVPYYCYHPGLGIDGSCRVCIVKIEKMPKLQTSCSTPVADGMVVHHADARRRRGARQRVRVPADQPPARLPGVRQGRRVPAAGFLLQLRARTRAGWSFRAACSTAKACRADVDFGPTLMLNRNRCILCTRCVRFMREVDGDAQINIIDRGYGSEIATFQEEGRALAALRQPDGRLPGRRDHDAGLPLQVAAVGQPGRGRHDLHALREGLQHDGVAQGQAGVGEGRAADPHDAALQSGRQRLLDVRHRPLRLPLDRRRRPAAAAAACATEAGALEPADWRERAREARRSRHGRRADPSALRFLVSAHASLEELFLIGRLGGAFGLPGDGVAVSWRTPREAAAAQRQVQDAAGRCAERQRRARPRLPGADAARRARRTSRRSAPRSKPGACRRSTSSTRAPTARSATCRGSSRRSASGKLPLLIVQGVLLTALAKAADFVLPGASWVEKDASYMNDQGRLQGAARAIPPPGDAQEDWQILVNVGLALGAALAYTSSAADSRRARRGDVGQPDATPALADARVRAAGLGTTLAAGVESVGALEVGLHVPGSAAGEVLGRPRVPRRRRA